MRIHVSLEVYSSFLTLKTHFGTPRRVFYQLSSGNAVTAHAEYEEDSVFVGNISVAEATFLTDFPGAIALVGGVGVTPVG